MKNKYFFLIIATIAYVLTVNIAQAAIFKCVNNQGATYYNDRPCPVSNKETLMRAAKNPKGGYVPPQFVAEQQKAKKRGVVVGAGSKSTKLNKNQNNNSNQANSSNSNSNNNSVNGSTASEKSQTSNSSNNVSGRSSTNSPNQQGLKHQSNNVVNKKPAAYRAEDY